MNTSHKYIGIAVVAIFIIGAGYIFSMKSNTTPATVTPPITTSTSTPTTSYTLAQVQTHNSQASCWTTIRGNSMTLLRGSANILEANKRS